MFSKKPITVAGAMSGTSIDGVDGAEIITDGERIFDFGPTKYLPYTSKERSILLSVLGKWPEDCGLKEARDIIHTKHIGMFKNFMNSELFGFHGQTLAHDPSGKGTHQLGNGQALAEALGSPVVWDFRSADVALGGQGAPLAPFFHFACAKWIGAVKPLAILNLGGIGNLTWIDPRKNTPESSGALLAFDTGPSNVLINDFMQKRFGTEMDRDGTLAKSGHVEMAALEVFLKDSYFLKAPPKSLDRDAFKVMLDLVSDFKEENAVATLTAMSAVSVIRGLEFCFEPPERILVTGGGRRNLVLMNMIATAAECQVCTVEDVGLDGDMLEAQAFAYLALRVARGLPTSCQSTTGVPTETVGGIVSFS